MRKLILLLGAFLICFATRSGAQTVQGTITTNGDVVIDNIGTGTNAGLVNVSGTWTGTLQLEYSANGGTTYRALAMINVVSLASVTSTTANGDFVAPLEQFTNVRVRASATITGTATVTIRASNNGATTRAVTSAGGGTIAASVTQGTIPWVVDGSGVTQPISGSVSITGTPAVTCASCLTDTQLRASAVPVSLAANQSVNVAQIAGSTVSTSATGVQKVGMNEFYAQGATTSGEIGPLLQAAVLTSAPTYTTAQTSPLNMTTAGDLRVTSGTTNLTTINNTTISTNKGTVDNGTFRVIPASATGFLANGITNSATTVTGSAATLENYFCYNPNTSVAYVQIYNISGAVSVGSSTPLWSIGIPASGGANVSELHLTFSNAIKVAATTTATGGSAPSTALDCNFGYR